jgi:hypothetical protein
LRPGGDPRWICYVVEEAISESPYDDDDDEDVMMQIDFLGKVNLKSSTVRILILNKLVSFITYILLIRIIIQPSTNDQ